MVKRTEFAHHQHDGSIVPEAWLNYLAKRRSAKDIHEIEHAINFVKIAGENVKTLTGESCLEQGLEMADLLDHLQMDKQTILCALIFPCTRYGEIRFDDLREQFSPTIAKLARGVIQMDAMRLFHQHKNFSDDQTQIDNFRKMILAMVQDIRVVFIKLAERTCWMRRLKLLNPDLQLSIAQETHDIYAPLANRLGIGQIKWELEDLSFRYLQPDTYKAIAKGLDQKRVEREHNIHNIISNLHKVLEQENITEFEIQGRAKHIFSIYRKMTRKGVDLEKIYDVSAVRVLVHTIEQCYAVLSLVHHLWQPIENEYDDYVSNPKPNGYRSLHTAVVDENNRTFEVQIRTYEMHQESELGVAAHWKYKEGKGQASNYDQKIAWLREMMAWQKEVQSNISYAETSAKIFEDRVYVFTPNNEIIELPQNSTPLDFAYQIHTEIGHRCRGAKINGQIVPLTYKLKTGDRIEIMTAKHANPSRDWLNPNTGFLHSSRSRAKVLNWFRKRDFSTHVADGQALLEKELKRINLKTLPNLQSIIERFNRKTIEEFYAGIALGDIKIGQVIHVLEISSTQEQAPEENKIFPTLPKNDKEIRYLKGINILGEGNLLTSIAKCCRPLPGDEIIGYITKNRGIAVHRRDCTNIINTLSQYPEKLVDVSWGDEHGKYPVDIYIEAYDRHGLIRDISTLLANEKINVIAVNTRTNPKDNIAHMSFTMEIPSLDSLQHVFNRLKHLANIRLVERKK